jgi:protein TonB
MNSSAEPNPSFDAAARRQRPLPATGLPAARDDRRGWGLLSLLLHLLLIMVLITPLASHDGLVIERPQGAGGAGPAGGGGGGHRGTGGLRETVRYVAVAAPPATKAPTTVLPPVPPKPAPVIPPPQAVTPPPTQIAAAVTPAPQIAKVEAAAPTPGSGGGTGSDGTAGTGPGSGGGVGSGIGTGRGSGVGPGTGGGVQANYPPTPIELFIPPLPMPAKVRGFHLVAEYDIDSTGKILGFNYTHTRDSGYNKRLEEVLGSFKFRPGTTPDGRPIRMKTQIIYDF